MTVGRSQNRALIWQVICTKVRDGDKRIVRLKEGEPRGRHVVIVDDLVQSGGTLIECQRLLTSQVGSGRSAYDLCCHPAAGLVWRLDPRHICKPVAMRGRQADHCSAAESLGSLHTPAGRSARECLCHTRRLPKPDVEAVHGAQQRHRRRVQVLLDHRLLRHDGGGAGAAAALRDPVAGGPHRCRIADLGSRQQRLAEQRSSADDQWRLPIRPCVAAKR